MKTLKGVVPFAAAAAVAAIAGGTTYATSRAGGHEQQQVAPAAAAASVTPVPTVVLNAAARLVTANTAGGTATTSVGASTYQTAAAAITPQDSKPDDDRPVYVFSASGDFVGHTAKVPQGLTAPVGHSITAIVDAATGRILTWTLTDKPHAVQALAPTPVFVPIPPAS